MQRSDGTEHPQPIAEHEARLRTCADLNTASPSATRAVDPGVLEVQHAQAVREIEVQRGQTGQLTTGINAQVGASILSAGKLALAATSTREKPEGPSSQFVVAAPPGTGKTSHAIALMLAVVRSAPAEPTAPYGCLFVVDQIKKADDIFRQIEALAPGAAAVWTSDHDIDCRQPDKVQNPAKRFHVDDLEHHAIAVVTQAFLRGPRGHKARSVLRGDHTVSRALTIFDEQTKEVEVYDVQLGDVLKVKEAIERRGEWLGMIIPQIELLIDFMRAKSKRGFDTEPTLETPLNDPEGWKIANDLQWFTTETAEQYVRRNVRDIPNLEEVFGFAAQLAKNFAFIFRRGGGEKGTYFVGYVPATTPLGTSILLDATADVDAISDLCAWREHVPVPEVRYDNLHIVHAEPYQRGNLTEILKTHADRRHYADHAKQLICEVMPAGSQGLVVCSKKLVDDHLIPDQLSGDHPIYNWPLDGRRLAVTYWGGYGIGVNDWNEADYVFEFGEYFVPRRTLIGMIQGLSNAAATEGILAASNNDRNDEETTMREGHLQRSLKQLGMRGRARHFDPYGTCGPQVLVLTCDFKRLLVNAHKLFPGATLSKWGRTQDRFKELPQSEKVLEILTDHLRDPVMGEDIAKLIGVRDWRDVAGNVMTPDTKAALGNIGWEYVSKRGRGGGSWFVRTKGAALRITEGLRQAQWASRTAQ